MDLPEETRAGLLANVAPGDNSPALTVSELSGALKRTIENAFGQVRVRGEISGFKRHGSGHCYFTLKDENACIDAVIWRTSAGTLAFRPDGVLGKALGAELHDVDLQARSGHPLRIPHAEDAGVFLVEAQRLNVGAPRAALPARGQFPPPRRC